MLRLLTDEDIDGAIVRGIRRRQLGVDLVRMQEVGLRTHSDEKLLEWAAAGGRIVVSNDRGTLIGLANARAWQAYQCLACSYYGLRSQLAK